MDMPRSPSVQSFASDDTVSIAFTSTPGSPAMPPVSDDAAARLTHEATDVPAQSHRFYLDVRSLKLKLDDGTFYHVHRHFFERHAPRFAEQYLCGETPDIIEVHDVSSVDFQRFLSTIYPRHVLSDLGVCDIHTVDEWTSVLRLANKWSVISLRDVAIREIETLRPTPIATILIAREFGLGEAWLVPAFVTLCKSMEPLGFEDAEPLGFRTAIEIARIKELYLRSGDSYDVETVIRASDVLHSLSLNAPCPRPASELAPATPVAIPTFGILPTSMVVPTPIDSYEPDHRPVLDHGHPFSSETHLPSDVNDNLAYLTMLASDHAEERLLIRQRDHSGVYRDLLALRIARRLVIETSNAAIRHRYWRHMWLKVGGYAASRNETVYGVMEVNPAGSRVYAIIDHALVEKRKRGADKGIPRPSSVRSFASNESISLPPSTTPTAPVMIPFPGNPRFNLSDGNIKFKLDDGSVYNVHRSFFEAHSPKFAAEFLCNSHAEVVRLPEISSVDFERFLSMIYPTAIGEFDVHTVAEWSSVLRLATKWSFDHLRTLALRKVEAIATAVDKIVLAREFDFGDAWIEPALKALCAAPGWLEYEEAERLGLRTVFEIGLAREKLRKATPSLLAVPIPVKPAAKKAGSVKGWRSAAAAPPSTSVPPSPPTPSSPPSGWSIPPCPRPTTPITPKECVDPPTKPLSKSIWGGWGNVHVQPASDWATGSATVLPSEKEEGE
ncbi:hypothetical protein EV714DRAFT_221731 [Schizophyllum commune]